MQLMLYCVCDNHCHREGGEGCGRGGLNMGENGGRGGMIGRGDMIRKGIWGERVFE